MLVYVNIVYSIRIFDMQGHNEYQILCVPCRGMQQPCPDAIVTKTLVNTWINLCLFVSYFPMFLCTVIVFLCSIQRSHLLRFFFAFTNQLVWLLEAQQQMLCSLLTQYFTSFLIYLTIKIDPPTFILSNVGRPSFIMF